MHESRSTASIIIRQSFYVKKQRVSHYSTQTIYCSCRADDKINPNRSLGFLSVVWQ